MQHTHLLKILKWKWQNRKVSKQVQPVHTVDLPQQQSTDTQTHFTWIGHATFLIQHQGINILTDPVFSKRASPFQFAGPKRVTPAAMNIDELPPIHIVVISHDHYDHLDKNSVLQLARQQSTPPLFVVPLGIGKWLSKRDIHSWEELDWWQSTQSHGWRFSAVPVQHFSGRGLKPNNTLWAGWVLESLPDNAGKVQRIFFAGDTGYSQDFKQIAQHFGPMDIALLPIGAYSPRWFMQEIHVNPEEAVQIHCDLNARLSIGMHWGAFVLTDEPMDEPPKQLAAARKKYQLQDEDFITLEHGQRFILE